MPRLTDSPKVDRDLKSQHALYGWKVDVAALVEHLKPTHGSRIHEVPPVPVLREENKQSQSQSDDEEDTESVLSWSGTDNSEVSVDLPNDNWWHEDEQWEYDNPMANDLEGLVQMLVAEIDENLCDKFNVFDDIVWVTRNYVCIGGRVRESGIDKIPQRSHLDAFAKKAGLPKPRWLPLDRSFLAPTV